MRFEVNTKITCTCVIGFVQKELVKDLLKECVKMHKFEHPNVLKLSGVCLDGGPAPYIIMPFMANGSLLTYLKNHRNQFVLDSSAENVVKHHLPVVTHKLISKYPCNPYNCASTIITPDEKTNT